MWSTEFGTLAMRLAALALLAGSTAVAQGQEARCPSHDGRAPLSGAVLFDGPAEQRADLMPDTTSVRNARSTSTWDVAYVYRQGRTLSIVCRYRGRPDAAPMVVSQPLQRCRYRVGVGRQPAEMACR